MEILEKKLILETRFLNCNETIYKDSKGFLKNWYWVERPGNRKAVMIVPIVEGKWIWTGNYYKQDNKIVVIKEFRVPIGDYEYGFPAGFIDENNNIEETAIRELKEETGLTVDKILKVSPFIYNTAGLTNESIAIVYVKATGTPSKEHLEACKDIETMLMNQNEVQILLNTPNIIFSAKAWIIMNSFVSKNHIV